MKIRFRQTARCWHTNLPTAEENNKFPLSSGQFPHCLRRTISRFACPYHIHRLPCYGNLLHQSAGSNALGAGHADTAHGHYFRDINLYFKK